jgi:trehalose 6-phosphate synthase
MYRSLSRPELLAFYRASELALIMPLKDGMNLIAKEYCACQIEEKGVLILSEFAGAADQLGPHSLLVNPYHQEQVADAIFQAFHMDSARRRARMRELRRLVKHQDVFWWVDGCLRAALDQPEPRRVLP